MTRRLGILLVLACAVPAAAEPLPRDAVPAPLAPWVDWVLHGHEAETCPFLDGPGGRRVCVWPSRLDLELDATEGRFSQEWWVHHESDVPLPGDARRWPQDVLVDGRPAAVIAVGGRPHLRLDPGRHLVRGRFAWDAAPELLQVPPETGLVELRLAGRPVPFPNRDAEGRLWLQKREEPSGGEQRLEVDVQRRLIDEVPLELETRIELQVAGRSREVLLGRALPDAFVPLSLASPLPARLDPDGRLRVQVRPGRWQLTLAGRHEGPAGAIALPDSAGPWDASEVWVFDARPPLRQVSVEGAVAVDPSQTRLPEAWKRLPAYLMEPGRALRLLEKRRGDADPAPDQLRLARVLWLDFDGGGYTARDRIDGVVRRSSRLEMRPPSQLGRVELAGRDQLITRLEEDGPSGVEVSRGPIQLAADSRIPVGAGWLVRTLPAVSWDQDFEGLGAELHLPPGWRLLHASGVDRAATSWIERWTLLDLFAVLILSAAFLRLWGPLWGALALLGLTLIWTEPGAPHWTWAAVLGGEALGRVLPEGRFPRFTRLVSFYRGAALALLLLLAIPFAVSQVRAGLFPGLARPYTQVPAVTFQPETDEVPQLADAAQPAESEMLRKRAAAPRAGEMFSSPDFYSAAKPERYAPDPKARITTGPGLPAWHWTRVALQWSGPVERGQELRLFLIPPFVNGVLAFARVVLLAALLLCLLAASAVRARRLLRRGGALLALLAVAAPGGARADDLPSPELLGELRQRLLEAPACRPACASSPRLWLEVARRSLRARIELHAAAATAVPLPSGRGWSPAQVLLDGVPAPALRRGDDATLWVMLDPGRHELVIEGPLPERDAVELPLPLRPHQVEVRRGVGWTLHGVHEDGVAEASLQLERIREAGAGAEDALEPGELPPFVRVERSLSLGLEWLVTTTVTRLSPADSALLLELPLLPGESVTTAGIRAEDGRALVSLAPGARRVEWTSLVEQRPELALRAPEDTPSTEVWRLDVSPVWHVDAAGIPPMQRPAEGARIREWHPWPGEELTLRVQRPAGVEGATATIDASQLELRPGLRATDAELSVTLRSSRGAPHVFTLPQGAELQSVSVDGAVQPIRQEGREVRVPLHPGRQEMVLRWREPRGSQSEVYRGSEVDLGMPGVNAEIRIAPSTGRWLLYVGGPRLGPAVLFWPLLLVVAAVAWGLSRLRLPGQLRGQGWTPLRFHHWLLLGIGLTQVPLPAAALVAAWLLALGWRGQRGTQLRGQWFDLLQIGLAVLTLPALAVLFWAIQQGLLGAPAMQIAGNGSSAGLLRWYQDRTQGLLPQPFVLSVPLWAYRLLMLAWALWLALALVRWLRWGWACFSAGELWRGRSRKVQPES